MDRRFLETYNEELTFLRTLGGEFAEQFPKIAGRLGIDSLECADPHVERLLEGFAFLAARVRRKLDAEFPRFTAALLETVYPHYLAPTPSLVMARFEPDLSEGDLAKGFPIPRGTALKSQLGKGDQTPCEFRTAHALELFPIRIEEARFHSRQEVPALSIGHEGIGSALSLTLRGTAGVPFDKMSLDRLPLYLEGPSAWRVHEILLSGAKSVVVRSPGDRKRKNVAEGLPVKVVPKGFDPSDALLPTGPRSFDGYRLLKEYFYCPQRFAFVEIEGLAAALSQIKGDAVEILIPLSKADESLTTTVSAATFSLFVTPAINLFSKRADRIHVGPEQTEFHVVPDRNRPLDYEVYSVSSVEGFGQGAAPVRAFLPFYQLNEDAVDVEGEAAYFTITRVPRIISAAATQRERRRSAYLGNEVFIALVDGQSTPYPVNLKQLGLEMLCTNRDLPIHMPRGIGRTDFSLEIAAPVKAIRCLMPPTSPKASHGLDSTAWRIVSHLSLNYLSLVDKDDDGAAGLRSLLRLYADRGEAHIKRQIDGVRHLVAKPIMRRVHKSGPISFARGLELTLTLDEMAFEGGSAFLMGAVLEAFFRRYAGINSFTETVLRTPEREEIMRWPARLGTRYPI